LKPRRGAEHAAFAIDDEHGRLLTYDGTEHKLTRL
jgi:hypothetical protein